MRLADQLGALRRSGPGALDAYRKNLRLSLYTKAQKIILGAAS